MAVNEQYMRELVATSLSRALETAEKDLSVSACRTMHPPLLLTPSHGVYACRRHARCCARHVTRYRHHLLT